MCLKPAKYVSSSSPSFTVNFERFAQVAERTQFIVHAVATLLHVDSMSKVAIDVVLVCTLLIETDLYGDLRG
jgi:hypothetical protein